MIKIGTIGTVKAIVRWAYVLFKDGNAYERIKIGRQFDVDHQPFTEPMIGMSTGKMREGGVYRVLYRVSRGYVVSESIPVMVLGRSTMQMGQYDSGGEVPGFDDSDGYYEYPSLVIDSVLPVIKVQSVDPKHGLYRTGTYSVLPDDFVPMKRGSK